MTFVELAPESEFEGLREVKWGDVVVRCGVPLKPKGDLPSWQGVRLPDDIINAEGKVQEIMAEKRFSPSWQETEEAFVYIHRGEGDFASLSEPRQVRKDDFQKVLPDGTDEMWLGVAVRSGVLRDDVLLHIPGMSGSPFWQSVEFRKGAGWTKAKAVSFVNSLSSLDAPVSFVSKSAQSPQAFKVTLPIAKAYAVPKPDGSKELWLTIEASGPEYDQDGTRMSDRCLKKMVEYIDRGWKGERVPYYDGHQRDLLAARLGWCHNPRLTGEKHVAVDVQLDQRNPASLMLYDDVTKSKQHGASIAGIVWESSVEENPKTGRTATVYDDVEIAEVSRTSYPSWTASFTTHLEKSLDKRLGFGSVLEKRAEEFGEMFGLGRLERAEPRTEHRVRVTDPGLYDRFARKEIAEGVDIVIGFKKEGGSEAQAYRFDAEKFTPKQVKDWLKENKVEYKEIEEAEPKKEAKSVPGGLLEKGKHPAGKDVSNKPWGDVKDRSHECQYAIVVKDEDGVFLSSRSGYPHHDPDCALNRYGLASAAAYIVKAETAEFAEFTRDDANIVNLCLSEWPLLEKASQFEPEQLKAAARHFVMHYREDLETDPPQKLLEFAEKSMEVNAMPEKPENVAETLVQPGTAEAAPAADAVEKKKVEKQDEEKPKEVPAEDTKKPDEDTKKPDEDTLNEEIWSFAKGLADVIEDEDKTKEVVEEGMKSIVAACAAMRKGKVKPKSLAEFAKKSVEVTSGRLSKATLQELAVTFESVQKQIGDIINILGRSTEQDVAEVVSKSVAGLREQLSAEFRGQVDELRKSYADAAKLLAKSEEEKSALAEALAGSGKVEPKGTLAGQQDTLSKARKGLWGRMSSEETK